MLLDGQQSVVARDQAFSGLRACSRNRKSRPLLSRAKSSSNFASRHATKALLRLERTRAMDSFLRIQLYTTNTYASPRGTDSFLRNADLEFGSARKTIQVARWLQ